MDTPHPFKYALELSEDGFLPFGSHTSLDYVMVSDGIEVIEAYILLFFGLLMKTALMMHWYLVVEEECLHRAILLMLSCLQGDRVAQGAGWECSQDSWRRLAKGYCIPYDIMLSSKIWGKNVQNDGIWKYLQRKLKDTRLMMCVEEINNAPHISSGMPFHIQQSIG